ncbi:MAG: hypothetical protein BM564_11560 [Bacteroidetes bacterium MedPE-SWsnd-G2]|nr:MAG: hypothetical protein BM564_11560 [Bacteroidetes bacterium MedPE-SWsnd-G2]
MKKLLLFTLACFSSSALLAQSYDSCTAASAETTITAGTYSVGTIDGDMPTSFCGGLTSNNVDFGEWIKYEPTQNYLVTVSSDLDTNGDKDTRLHIFVGTCGALQCVTGDDDSGDFTGTNSSSYLSVATFLAEENETYYIVWDDKWNDSSDFDFSLTEDDAPPVEEEAPVIFEQSSIAATGNYDSGLVDMNGDYLDDPVSISSTTININYQLAPDLDGTPNFNPVDITTTTADFLPSWSMAAGDWDANGYNDLLYGAGNGVTFMTANVDGTAFSETSGPEDVFSQRSNFVDINNDGLLDAFVCHDVAPSVSYINNGTSLIFENTNGLGDYTSGGNYASVWIDFDNDHDIDMFMAKCGGSTARRTNQLYENLGDINEDGTNVYQEIGVASNLADPIQTWSAAWGDYDNDGDMDCYVGSSTGYDHKIMRNNGDKTFTDVTVDAGVSTANIGHENVPGDFDNDGILDIYSNGSILFGNGDLTFTVYTNVTIPSVGSIGDLNNDGFLDFFEGSIFVNQGNDNNWIKIVTKGMGHEEDGLSNINGIGARVEINTASGTQIRDVRSGEGFRHMHSLNTHFGIGADTEINYIKIYWPSGIEDVILDPNINEVLVVEENTFSTLDLSDPKNDNIILYPNPTKDYLNLTDLQSLDDPIFSVFDINGRRVMNARLSDNKIDVSHLSVGQYVLRVTSGNKVLSQKFMKK